jgi:hypothetical protein
MAQIMAFQKGGGGQAEFTPVSFDRFSSFGLGDRIPTHHVVHRDTSGGSDFGDHACLPFADLWGGVTRVRGMVKGGTVGDGASEGETMNSTGTLDFLSFYDWLIMLFVPTVVLVTALISIFVPPLNK